MCLFFNKYNALPKHFSSTTSLSNIVKTRGKKPIEILFKI